MEDLWSKHPEAQDFAGDITQPAVRAVLRGLNNLLLESTGFLPEFYLRPRITPATPLNLLRFYKLVAQVFSDPAVGTTGTMAANGSPQLVGMDAATRLAESYEPARCRNVLLQFLTLASTDHLPTNEQFDVLYCCRLLAAVVPNEEALDHILSGAAERKASEFMQNPEEWFG